jgi:anaerobic magnesium-protoporphyrin IX monomethyl ester cyclase
MKVLLTSPPGQTTERWPPLGLLYLASGIKQHRGDEVIVLDAFCMNLSREQFVERIVRERPDFVGLSTSTHTFLESIHALGEVSKALPGTIIAMGGYHATFAAEQILREYPFVKYILKGEAERSLVMLLDCVDKEKEPADVEGISYLAGGEYVSREPTLIENLDELPFPDRGMLDGIDYGYVFQGIPLTFGKFTTINTSRGCPYNCSYCSCATFSRHKLRYRSPENVIEEIQLLYDKGYRDVVIVDDNFTQKKDRVERICELINDRHIKMRFYCEGRVNNSSPEMFRKMKKAGFAVIFFGAESASRRVLDYYHKKLDPEQTMAAVQNAKNANLLVITSFILGAPVERREDMEETIDLIRKLRPHGVEINVLDILIGTRLWDDIRDMGKIGPDDWQTNHRVYDYLGDICGRDELESMRSAGYAAYIKALASPRNIGEISRLLLRNSAARNIVFKNFFNPSFFKTLRLMSKK